jgi:hypothetical protein
MLQLKGSQRSASTLQVLLIAVAAVVLSFVWQGNKGFNLGDEGFLWYGAQRVLAGEVPVRDFMAYEPGRYYWSAVLMSLFGGDGIMSLRYAVAVFQVLGLFIGLVVIANQTARCSLLYLLLSALTLLLWMYPRHKLFDASLSIFLIGLLTLLIERPTPIRYFLAGIGVGLVATFGRNHGLYGALGSLGAMVWLAIGREPARPFRSLAIWSAGVLIGFMPLIQMAIWIPGFADAFWNGIRILLDIKGTNIGLPVPWPWRNAGPDGNPGEWVRSVLIGLYFVAVVVFAILGLAWTFIQRVKHRAVPAGLVAASLLGPSYAQYALSRADIGHLALGIFPLLTGCLIVFSTLRASLRWLFATLLCASSIWTMYAFQPGWLCASRGSCVETNVLRDRLQVDPGTASTIRLIEQLDSQYAPQHESFLVTPFWPSAYALMERKAPTWEIYALFPRPPAFERAEIARIEAAHPSFVLLLNSPLDGRDELRFSRTHPLTYQYLLDHYQPAAGSTDPDMLILKPRNQGK